MKPALAQVRAVLRNRDRPAPGDIAYRAYLSIMLVIVVLVPLIRGSMLWLAEVLPAGSDPTALQPWWGSALALLLLLPVAGWYFSPIRVSLPELDLLFTSALPRWKLLVGRFIRGGIFAVLVGTAVAGLLVGVRMVQGEPTQAIFAPVLLAGVAVGLIAYLLLLFGQVCRGTRWQVLREQAERLDAVSTLVMTGDFRSAASHIGAPVKLGRTWGWALQWLRGANAQRSPARCDLLLFVLRDCIGIIRTPLRSSVALFGTMVAGFVAGLVLVTASADTLLGTGTEDVAGSGAVAGSALGGAVALLLIYASIGPWCRGLRTAGETVGASPLLPYSASGLLLRHLVVPASLSTLACVGSSTAAVLMLAGSVGAHLSSAALLGLVLSLIAIALRLLGSLKGPLPQSFLAPIPTPAGDLSAINVMFWNLDGPILATLIGACLLSLAVVVPLASLVSAIVAVAVLLLWSNIRLQSRN